MSPGAIVPWIPVVRELVDLVLHIRNNVRRRRAKRAKSKVTPC